MDIEIRIRHTQENLDYWEKVRSGLEPNTMDVPNSSLHPMIEHHQTKLKELKKLQAEEYLTNKLQNNLA
jgi:hypothetical protein|tara:strand:- start:154 stop:360 length:207 start_codon:yes stop_codon:yes gene_type:complete